MAKTIWFDMDGTIADLYGQEDWLKKIRTESVAPYVNAKPLVSMSHLSRKCRELQRKGYKIGIISWTAKGGSDDYNTCVAYAKCEWLQNHLPKLKFDEIHICNYGISKNSFRNENDILIDDNEKIRKDWGNGAYPPIDIIKTLNEIAP